jgi:hypothetical protein
MTQPCTKEKELQYLRDHQIEMGSDIKYIRQDIESVKKNHLPHIYTELEKLNNFKIEIKTKIAIWATVGSLLGGALVQIFIKYLIK